MTEVWFYHLQTRTLDQVLPELLEKTLARGLKAVVRAGSPERVAALDAHLWAYRDDSFLPHGTAADDHSVEQPIFLTADQTCPNHAQFLFLVDGAEGGGFEAYQRCIDLFDGRDEAAVAAARERWRAAKAQGFELAYWQQDDTGKWERKN